MADTDTGSTSEQRGRELIGSVGPNPHMGEGDGPLDESDQNFVDELVARVGQTTDDGADEGTEDGTEDEGTGEPTDEGDAETLEADAVDDGEADDTDTGDESSELFDEADLEGLSPQMRKVVLALDKRMQAAHTKRSQGVAGERKELQDIRDRMLADEESRSAAAQPTAEQVQATQTSAIDTAIDGVDLSTVFGDELKDYAPEIRDAFKLLAHQVVGVLQQPQAQNPSQQTDLHAVYERHFKGMGEGWKPLEADIRAVSKNQGGLDSDPDVFMAKVFTRHERRTGDDLRPGRKTDTPIQKAEQRGAAKERKRQGQRVTRTRRTTSNSTSTRTRKPGQATSMHDGIADAIDSYVEGGGNLPR